MEPKRGDCVRVYREKIKFIALPFPFSSHLKIWSFHVSVVQERQRNVQKSVMQVRVVVLLIKFFAFLTFPLPSPSLFRKVPTLAKTRSRVKKAITFSRQNDAGSRASPITAEKISYSLSYSS